jgi:hypothetical protein
MIATDIWYLVPDTWDIPLTEALPEPVIELARQESGGGEADRVGDMRRSWKVQTG